MTDNPYRTPTAAPTLIEKRSAVQRRYRLSESGMYALGVIFGGTASVLMFCGEYFNLNHQAFSFGGGTFLVIAVSAVSVCHGARHAPATGSFVCLKTCSAGIISFVVGAWQMSSLTARVAPKSLLVLCAATEAVAFTVLLAFYWMRRHAS